jgi:hypothetical protein
MVMRDSGSSFRWGRVLAWVFLLLVVLIIAGYLWFPLPTMFASIPPNPAQPLGAGGPVRSDGSVPIVSTAQGAQDAETAEIMVSPRVDRQKCVDRLLARKMSREDTAYTCDKIIEGIYN